MFWYLNGFDLNNGNLKTVPARTFRNDTGAGRTDDDIWAGARQGAPATGELLAIRKLACPRGSVVVMTHGPRRGAPLALPAS